MTTWLIVIWFVVLYWGEVKVFNDAVDDCSWENWEQWVCTARALVKSTRP